MTDMEEILLALEDMRWLKEVWGKISYECRGAAIESIMLRLERIRGRGAA